MGPLSFLINVSFWNDLYWKEYNCDVEKSIVNSCVYRLIKYDWFGIHVFFYSNFINIKKLTRYNKIFYGVWYFRIEKNVRCKNLTANLVKAWVFFASEVFG